MSQALPYTGRIVTPDGVALAGATVRLSLLPHAVSVRPPAAVAPLVVTVTTDEAGVFACELVSGTYAVRVTSAEGRTMPTFTAVAPGDWLLVEGEELTFDGEPLTFDGSPLTFAGG